MTPLAKVIYCADFLEPAELSSTIRFACGHCPVILMLLVKAVVISLLDHRKVRKHTPCQRERALMISLGLGDNW